MNTKKLTLLLTFTCLFLFAVISRIFFNDFQEGWEAYVKKDYKTAHELWLPLAEQGDSKAQFFLGFMHDLGFGLPENDQEAVKWYRLAAEQGDSRAQLFTGLMYDNGQGVPQDDQEAIKWYRLAAEQGYDEAKTNILKLEKKKAPQDDQKAVKLYQPAAGYKAKTNIYNLAKKNVPQALKILKADVEKGIAEAQYTLGMMYASGQGVPQDDQEAMKWYRLAAEQGYGEAKSIIYNLAGKNVPQALKILIDDAENGIAKAQISLGVMYANGQGVSQDDQEAVKWYRLAAEQGYGEARAIIYNMAQKNVPQALKFLTKDAENGVAEAQMSLGMMYANGQGVPQDDQKAVKWYRLAAEQRYGEAKAIIYYNMAKKNVPQALKLLINDAENGVVKAQYTLGVMYARGQDVPQDGQEAVKWYRLVAEQDDSRAQYDLGVVYANGQEVPKDDREALKWFQLSMGQRVVSEKNYIYSLAKKNIPQALGILVNDAENGVVEAQNNLGVMYANGQGVPQDYVLANMWYNLSGLQGHKGATNQISLLEKNMSPQQIEQAQEMVRDWKPKQ